jgi:Asp/Glu/hydantoin racemase
MNKKLGLIHTAATLIPVFQQLVDKHLGDKNISVFNISDDSLIKNTIESGALTADTSRRVIDYVVSAKDAGADYILVTCSSIGPAVETAATLVNVPVLRVDQPMVDQAVQMGKKIGVIATLSTTLEPTVDLVRRRAVVAKKEVVVTTKLCEGAFEALISGNIELHDQSVALAMKALSQQVEVILLAQASMARVINQLSDEDKKVPILASPELAIQYLSEVW